jgi:hypothetical protein
MVTPPTRCRRIGLVVGVVERVDRGSIAPQQSLARTVEIDDGGGHGITLLCKFATASPTSLFANGADNF